MLSQRFNLFAHYSALLAFILVLCVFCPQRAQAAPCDTDPCLDVHNTFVETVLKRPVRHHQLSEHFEIFYNPYHEERSEGIQEFLAPSALDFAECTWALFFDPRLAGEYPFEHFSTLPWAANSISDRFPIWVRAHDCRCDECSCDETKSQKSFRCTTECLSTSNGGLVDPRIFINPIGSTFGCPSHECCDAKRDAEIIGDGIGNDDGYCAAGQLCADDPFCIVDEDCAVTSEEDANGNGICDAGETCQKVDCTDEANYRINCCGSGFLAPPQPAGFGSVTIHEMAHSLFKGHSRVFNSGALQFLNEGLPSGIMTVPITSLSYTCSFYSPIDGRCIDYRPVNSTNVNFRAYANLSNMSLREPSYSKGGPSFWYFLAERYGGITDAGYETEYDDAVVDSIVVDGRQVCRNFINRIACAPGGGECQPLKMRRIPGREILVALQSQLKACHPLGKDTPVCMATTETADLDVRCAGEPGYPHGCVPGRTGKEWEALWGEENGVHHVGDTLMPKLMELVDKTLVEHDFMTEDGSGIPAQAFREFLIWNYMNGPRATRAYSDGQKGYRIKSFGAHYHKFHIPAGGLRIYIESKTNMPLWAHAVIDPTGFEPVIIHDWDTSPSREIFIPGSTIGAVLVLTTLGKTYDQYQTMPYADSGGHYMLIKPDVFDDDDTGTPNDPAITPPAAGWPAARNDNLFAATPLELVPDAGGSANLSIQKLNIDSSSDQDYFAVKVPPADPNISCSCSCLNSGDGMKLVLSTSSEVLGGDGLPIDVFYHSSGGAPSDEQVLPPLNGLFRSAPLEQLGWRIALDGQTEVDICCPHDTEISGDPLLTASDDLIFSVNGDGSPLSYDLEMRYEAVECDVPGPVAEVGPVVEIFDPKVKMPRDRIYPSERRTILDCLESPLACSEEPEVLGFDWDGGDFSVLADYQTTAVDREFRMKLIDTSANVVSESKLLILERGLQLTLEDIGYSENPPQCSGVLNQQQEEVVLQNTGQHLLSIPKLKPGRYYITVEGAFPTRYRFQIGDRDGDGVADVDDVCPAVFDPEQLDSDYDGLGDECDICPTDAGNDADKDGFCAGAADCADDDPSINLGAGELCDNVDNNCNALVDESHWVAFKKPLRTNGKIRVRGSRTIPIQLKLRDCDHQPVYGVPARLSLFKIRKDGSQVAIAIGPGSDSNTAALVVDKQKHQGTYLLRTKHLESGEYRLFAQTGPQTSAWADFELKRRTRKHHWYWWFWKCLKKMLTEANHDAACW